VVDTHHLKLHRFKLHHLKLHHLIPPHPPSQKSGPIGLYITTYIKSWHAWQKCMPKRQRALISFIFIQFLQNFP
jgi:hypothetical protein